MEKGQPKANTRSLTKVNRDTEVGLSSLQGDSTDSNPSLSSENRAEKAHSGRLNAHLLSVN